MFDLFDDSFRQRPPAGDVAQILRDLLDRVWSSMRKQQYGGFSHYRGSRVKLVLLLGLIGYTFRDTGYRVPTTLARSSAERSLTNLARFFTLSTGV